MAYILLALVVYNLQSSFIKKAEKTQREYRNASIEAIYMTSIIEYYY